MQAVGRHAHPAVTDEGTLRRGHAHAPSLNYPTTSPPLHLQITLALSPPSHISDAFSSLPIPNLSEHDHPHPSGSHSNRMLQNGHWPLRTIDVSAYQVATFILFVEEAMIRMRRVPDIKIGHPIDRFQRTRRCLCTATTACAQCRSSSSQFSCPVRCAPLMTAQKQNA